jgi:preprotein translocase subunit SecE
VQENKEMDGIKSYLLESYDEMVHKVSWPNWSSLQNSAIVVLFTTFLFAMVVYAMDSVFGQMMKLYYIEIFGS